MTFRGINWAAVLGVLVGCHHNSREHPERCLRSLKRPHHVKVGFIPSGNSLLGAPSGLVLKES